MDAPHTLSARALAAAFCSGETTPSAVVEHLLARIERYDEAVGAFVTVTPDQALAAAEVATRAYASEDHATLPPLYGVPTAIKDLHPVAGVRTTYGSAALADTVPDFSDAVVTKIEAAGLISLGKTNTPELGTPCYTEPDIASPARTPYDLDRSAGGSSGGAAAAVSAGLLPIAHGSDGGGSIRIPASVCGLVGLKPTRGRVSRAPFADITGLATSGPLARTVRDAAAFLDAMAGPAPGDATWAPPLPAGETFLACCDHEPGALRIARFSTPVIADVEVDAEVLAAYEAMSALLVRLGHQVEDIDVPVPPSAVPAFETVWAVGAALAPIPPDREHLLRPLTRWLRSRATAVSGPELGRALAAMGDAGAAAIRALRGYDAVLTPTLARLPAKVGELRDDADPAADFAAQKAYTPYTSAWNVTGMPAISLPAAWSASGLPIGTMVAARPGREDVLCALGAQIERARSTPDDPEDWSRPPVKL